MTIPTPDVGKFLAERRDFFEYIFDWMHSLPNIKFTDLTDNGSNGCKTAIISVDFIKGFTSEGVLASPRIAAIVPRVTRLFENAHDAGVNDFLLIQDSHPQDSMEFEAFGSHCEEGSRESETVDALADLPFASKFTIMPKTALDPSVDTDMDKWIDDKPEMASVVIVGDCTDICIYLTAMHIKARSVAMRRRLDVIVPADSVQTYHLNVKAAKRSALMPHDGDLLHLVFLYHMALCGIHVVKSVEGA